MIYYCTHKDECGFGQCSFQRTESKLGRGERKEDLTINGFSCIMVNKNVRLISSERIVCDRYRRCDVICQFKTIYITTSNFEKYLGKLDLLKPYRCKNTGYRVKLWPDGRLAGDYISIWDKPSLFTNNVI